MVQQIKGTQCSPSLQGHCSPSPGGRSSLEQPDVSTRFCKPAPGLIATVCSRNQKVLPGCERFLTATRPESLPPSQRPRPMSAPRLEEGWRLRWLSVSQPAAQLCKPMAMAARDSHRLRARGLCLSWTTRCPRCYDPGWGHTV